jgi:hypothetical protein
MDKVFGNEDTSNPLLCTNTDALGLLKYSQPNTSGLTPEITSTRTSSVVVENVNEAGEMDSFNSGKRIKNKDDAKSDILMDLMIDKMTIEAKGREKKEEKQEQRFETKELRTDKLVNILENLAQHLMKE